MLNPDIAERIRAIFMHDGSSVTVFDFVILLGWSVAQFEDAVNTRVITVEAPATGVPRISRDQLLAKASERWSRGEITEALGIGTTHALVPARVAPIAARRGCDVDQIGHAAPLQVVTFPATAAVPAAGLRAPHRTPLPRRRSRSRVIVTVPPPSLPSSRRRRTDGVREATLASFEVGYQDYVPSLRLRGRWLAQHGFNVGARIYISVTEDKLVITAADPVCAESRNAV